MNAEWTTEYPTEPGYYWLRNYRLNHWMYNREAVQDLEIVQLDECLERATFCGNDVPVALNCFISAEWLGPIHPPEAK